jgi:uracil-DNA glycosylase
MSWKNHLPKPPYNYGHIVPPEGPMDAKIALVGEAPGEDEVLNLPPRTIRRYGRENS